MEPILVNSAESKPPLPPTYLVWAILTTILCCLPFGIVAIVKSAKVESYYVQGLYAESLRASKEAKKWSIVSACVAGGVWVVYAIVIVAIALAGACR